MPIKRTKEIQRHLSMLESVKVFFDEMANKREEKFEGRSDKWKESEKGEAAEQDQEQLRGYTGELEEVYTDLEDLFEQE
jgi:hypothetical protein